MVKRVVFFIIGAILFFDNLSAKELNKLFQLIPLPQKVEVISGKGIAFDEILYILSDGNNEYPVLSDVLDRLPRYVKKGKGVILKQKETAIPNPEEGYILEVGQDKIIIQAQTEAGLFYGCQTLAQLMEDSRDFNLTIPCMRITDYPSLSYRAVHFDVKHHLDNINYYYTSIDKLARYKVNAIIWEIEDKLNFSRRREVSAPNAISKQEMQAISRYAKERHIEISPLVQGLGHASFILKHHWELRENPESDWGFCPSDPRTYELQFDLYKDAMEAFPYGKYLHIGGDEVSELGTDSRCRLTGKSPLELQMTWLRKVCTFAVENGRTPIFWDDMPLKHAGIWKLFWNNLSNDDLDKVWNTQKLDEAIALFPKECIYMRWNYFDIAEPINERVLEWYRSKGLNVMGSTAAAAGDSPIMPRNDSRLKEIIGFNRLAAKCNLIGVLTTGWDDGSPHWETIMRGFIAQGEFGWNPEGRSQEDFIVAHGRREFGFSGNEKEMLFLSELEKAMFFFDSALVESGNRNPAYQCGDFVLIDLPDSTQSGKWTEKYNAKIEQATQEAVRYESICKLLNEARQRATRNRFALDIYTQINELQQFPTRLLLALSQYDKAGNPDSRKQAAERLKDICSSFYTMRIRLESVYGKTRFMSMPDGYLAGSNHSKNVAARTYNSDWMFLYELPMVKQIEKWLNN